MKWFSKVCVFLLLTLVAVGGARAADSTGLPIERRMLFNTWGAFFPLGSYYDSSWTHVGPTPPAFPASSRALLPGTNHVHSAGWKIVAARTGTSGLIEQYIPPQYYTPPSSATNWQVSLQNTLDAKIESPYYPEGIGSIYFDAINVRAVDPTEITVEIATNMIDYIYAGGPTNIMLPEETPQYSNDWQTLDVLTLSAVNATNFTTYIRKLNYRAPARFRIRRSGETRSGYPSLDNAFTAIDNICASFPPSDVVISRPDTVFQPGHPSVATNIAIRCVVDNLGTNDYERTDHNTRSLTAYYRWRYLNQASNAWSSVSMAYVTGTGDEGGNGEIYSATLPIQTQVGDLEYYFVCNFEGYRYRNDDYTQTGRSFVTEWLSPRTLRGGASQPDGREFYARLRPYYSRFGDMSVVTDQHAEPVEMFLVGDELWRGLVPLNNGAITNLAWCFKGTDAYVDGADAFDTNVFYWAEAAQASLESAPYGGSCVQTPSSSRIHVLVNDSGYLQLDFNTKTLEFMASRAEYQNFNAWPAPPNTFTDSGGQASKQRFDNTFDAWPTNTGISYSEYFIGQDVAYEAHTNYTREPFGTFNSWLAGSAAYVRDRFDADMYNKPADGLTFRNIALRMKGGAATLGLGYVHNSVNTRPDGLDQIAFASRLGQPIDRNDVCYQKFSFASNNYAVITSLKADAGMSPENPSMSVIGYYKDPDNFYEFRMTQVTNAANLTTTGDKRMHFQLFKWANGVPYQLAISRPNQDAVLTSETQVEFRFYNRSSTATDVRCRFGVASWSQVLSYTDSGTVGGAAIQAGSYGFLSADCRARFSNVRLQATTLDATLSGSATTVLSETLASYQTQILEWYLPTGRFSSTPPLTTPNGIYSVIPTQKLGVYLQASSRDSEEDPAAPGTTNWVLHSQVSLSSFGYVTNAVAIHNWRSQFVMLQVMGRDDGLIVDVAVDGLKVSPWRGQVSCDSGDTENPFEEDWVATEAWVVSNATANAHVVQLDHTRADPAENQAIRSLLLTNGMGMLEFDYKVVRAPAKLTVQYADEGDDNLWYDIQSVVVSNAMSSFSHMLAYLGTNQPGYLRVLNDRAAGAYTNALVEFDNMVAWDEPYIDDASWRAYNVKVTDTDTMRVLLDESKACFLNNSATLETSPAQTLYDPFVQSPRLAAGLGAVTFMARTYSNSQPATVSVWVTSVGWGAPTNDWVKVHQFSVTNMLYQTYTYKPADGRPYKSVKLVTGKTAADRRACIDEVVVSEPLFPSFKIVNVTPLCKDSEGDYSQTRFQPLDSDEVGIQAQISNIQLDPQDIQMFVSYYVGTNVWGIDNWPSNMVVTKPMYPVGLNNLYRTSPTNDLPFQEKDTIVQYHVWATYKDSEGVALITEQLTFENPAQYFPLDLNQKFGASGWSPYYIVYGLPLNTVWINEVNAVDVPTNGVHHYGENNYIELAVPVGIDLTGWQIDLVNNVGTTTTITLPSGLPDQQEVTNGYAFFVITDTTNTRPNSATVPLLPKIDYCYPYFSEVLPNTMPGGIRLRRPLGMYEHTVAYDWYPYWVGFSGETWAANDPEGKFVYVGVENQGGSLSVTNASGAVKNDWVFPLTWTPGTINVGQTVPNAVLIAPGISNAVVMSYIDTINTTQNGRRISPLTFKVRKGDTTPTNIVYVADTWYRIHSITLNGVEQMAPGEELITNQVQLVNLQTNVEIHVDVGLRYDVASLGVSGPVLAWLLQFGDRPLVPSYYYGRELTLTELFWLNANPTVENMLEGGITKIEKTAETNFYVTSWLALNGQNCTNLQGDSTFQIRVKHGLADPEWKMIAQYTFSTNSFTGSHTNRAFVFNPYQFQLTDWDTKSLFFQWVIEMEDPRFSVQELIHNPE